MAKLLTLSVPTIVPALALGLVLAHDALAQAAPTRLDDNTDAASPHRYVVGLSLNYGPEAFGAPCSKASLGFIGSAEIGAWRLSTGGGRGLLNFGQDDPDRGAGASREIFRNAHWRVGLGLRLDGGRRSNGYLGTRGLPDVERTVRARLYASYQPVPGWALQWSWQPDLLARRGGWLGSIELDHLLMRTDQAQLHVGVAAQWGDGRYMQSYFGIPESAVGADHPQSYLPSAGMRDAGLHLRYTRSFGRHWLGFAGLGWGSLLGPARDSPLTVRAASWGGSMGVAYRF